MIQTTTSDQINALQHTRNNQPDSITPAALIRSLADIESEQAQQLRQIAIMTQDHLNIAIGLYIKQLSEESVNLHTRSVTMLEQQAELLTLLDLVEGVDKLIKQRG